MRKLSVLARQCIDISYRNNLSHIGSVLSVLEVIEEIYAQMKEDEVFVLSSGHGHLAHLVVKEKYGLVNAEQSIQKWGIHCDKDAGCDVSTGSLGCGLGIALGRALADRQKFVYVVISDGEMGEGSVFEALRIAKELKVSNLRVYVNVNGWGAYKKIDPQEIVSQLTPYDRDGAEILVMLTNSDINDRIKGQKSHYLPLTEEEYAELS